jgi:hypothetical protein
MKTWISRNKESCSDEVHIHLEKPDSLNGSFFSYNMIADIRVEDFNKAFDFIPNKGSCKEYELLLSKVKK